MAHTSDSAAQTERADEQCRQDQLETVNGRENGRVRGHGAARQGKHGDEQGAHAGRARVAETATTGARKKKTEKADMTPRKDTQRGQGAGGGGNRGPTRAQSSTLSHTEKRHADDPH